MENYVKHTRGVFKFLYMRISNKGLDLGQKICWPHKTLSMFQRVDHYTLLEEKILSALRIWNP